MTSLLSLYEQTKEKKYLDFVISYIDYFVEDDGTIKTYDYTKYSTDDICESRVLFDLYHITGNEKYRKAIENTYKQIEGQPRTKEGNFWHKKYIKIRFGLMDCLWHRFSICVTKQSLMV